MIRLLLVDDQPLFRQGLAALLALESDLEIVGQANDGQAAISLAAQLQPDVLLMDVRMPMCDGVRATQDIHQRFPWIRILVLTTFDQDDYIWKSLQAGALGYLLKSTPAPQLATAIRTLHQGYCQLGPTIAPKVIAQLNAPAITKSDEQYCLTERERGILQELAMGKSNREIAQTLYLTEGTVKNYVSQVLNRLGMRDRTQAAPWAKQYLQP
ncbi:MAG: response regulator transcription factor [Synechococcales cyanobacterium M58_A2018_015]|nr:response regulator transcription factor [Synechococcales cyanobacterium M58_A2018_015]MBF2026963.1 response regulator transcription factor [Leptolyngbyaceae cyanobacterium C42_A2020_001]